MLTEQMFKDRVQALWDSQKRMAAEKKWQTGKRAGAVRLPAATIWFTKEQLRAWLWEKVGLNAIPCPYCSVPIDILNLVPDHVLPRAIGGPLALDNMELICKSCNEMKGPMSKPAFVGLRAFILALSEYDQKVIHSRLKAAHHGSAQRFFRQHRNSDSLPPKPKLPPAVQQKPLNLDDF